MALRHCCCSSVWAMSNRAAWYLLPPPAMLRTAGLILVSRSLD